MLDHSSALIPLHGLDCGETLAVLREGSSGLEVSLNYDGLLFYGLDSLEAYSSNRHLLDEYDVLQDAARAWIGFVPRSVEVLDSLARQCLKLGFGELLRIQLDPLTGFVLGNTEPRLLVDC